MQRKKEREIEKMYVSVQIKSCEDPRKERWSEGLTRMRARGQPNFCRAVTFQRAFRLRERERRKDKIASRIFVRDVKRHRGYEWTSGEKGRGLVQVAEFIF